MHMHSSHHSITLMHPKTTKLFFYKNIFFSLLCVARDSNVNLYVLMWSPRQQYVFVSVLFISINILHASSLFYLLT